MKKMITELTLEQKARFPEFVDKWLKIGLSTDRLDYAQALNICQALSDMLKKPKPKLIIIMNNPLFVWLAIHLLKQQTAINPKVWEQVESEIASQVESQVRSQIRAQVWAQVGEKVWKQVRAQVRAKVKLQVAPQVWEQVSSQIVSQVRGQVRAQVWAQVDKQVASQVWEQVESQVEEQVVSQFASQVKFQVREQVASQVDEQVASEIRMQVENFIWPYLDGHFWASWFSFFDYCEVVLGIRLGENYDRFKSIIGFELLYPFDDLWFFSQKPLKIHFKNGVLHKEGEPAVEYADSFSIWSLNGVRVPQWLAETRDTDIDPARIIEIDNAEARREFVRKVGIDRICYKLNARRIDERDDYELLELVISNRKYRYLKMLNPSIETWHVEGVPIDTKSVSEAIHWRKPDELRELPVDDVNGMEYFQQGDVLIWPQKAKAVQSKPIVLS